MIVVVPSKEYTGRDTLDTEEGLKLETVIICNSSAEFSTARRIAEALEVDMKKEYESGESLVIPIYSTKTILQ